MRGGGGGGGGGEEVADGDREGKLLGRYESEGEREKGNRCMRFFSFFFSKQFVPMFRRTYGVYRSGLTAGSTGAFASWCYVGRGLDVWDHVLSHGVCWTAGAE